MSTPNCKERPQSPSKGRLSLDPAHAEQLSFVSIQLESVGRHPVDSCHLPRDNIQDVKQMTPYRHDDTADKAAVCRRCKRV